MWASVLSCLKSAILPCLNICAHFLSGVYGDCQKVLVMQHNSTYEDDLDHMDSVSTLNAAIDAMATLSNSLYNAVVTMKIDAEKLEKNPLVLSVVRESVQFG